MKTKGLRPSKNFEDRRTRPQVSTDEFKTSSPRYKPDTYPHIGGKLFKKEQKSTAGESFVRGELAGKEYAKEYHKGQYSNSVQKTDKYEKSPFERDQPSVKGFKTNRTRYKDAGASLKDMGITPELINEVKKRYKK